MFGHRFYGARYFGPVYWGDGGDGIPPEPPDPTPQPVSGGGGWWRYEPPKKAVVRLRKRATKKVEEAVEEMPYGYLFGYEDLLSIAKSEVLRTNDVWLTDTLINEISERAVKGIWSGMRKRQEDDEDDMEAILLLS